MAQQGLFKTEDWWAVWLGMLVFILSLFYLAGADLLGWVGRPMMWTDFSKSFGPISTNYSSLGGFGSRLGHLHCLSGSSDHWCQGHRI